MIDQFLKIAYNKSRADQQRHETHELLKKLPNDVLYKLANGELTKEALLDDCGPKDGDDAPKTWLDKFKGTPLFDKAMSLEQGEIQSQMEDLDKQQQRRAEQASENEGWQQRDHIRLQKKLLELELAQVEMGAPMPGEAPPGDMGGEAEPPPPGETPPAGPQGAGAPGPETPNPEKTVTAAVKWADQLGRDLAQGDFQKTAMQKRLLEAGNEAGRVLTKIAAPPGLGALASKAMGVVKAKPSVLMDAAKKVAPGMITGAVGGAAAGAANAEEGHGIGGAITGGLGGAAMGGLAQGALKMHGAAGKLQARKPAMGYGDALRQSAGTMLNRAAK